LMEGLVEIFAASGRRSSGAGFRVEIPWIRMVLPSSRDPSTHPYSLRSRGLAQDDNGKV
jgi:hypothetical protein